MGICVNTVESPEPPGDNKNIWGKAISEITFNLVFKIKYIIFSIKKCNLHIMKIY